MSTFYEREQRAKKLYEREMKEQARQEPTHHHIIWPAWEDLDERERKYYLEQAQFEQARESLTELRKVAIDPWAIPLIEWLNNQREKHNGKKPR